MELDDIITESRVLVNKLHAKTDAKFTKEDYIMMSVSLFVARKESIIKKNNKNNTLYFDYEKNKKDLERMIVFEELSNEIHTIYVNIPNLGEFDLTIPGCFDNIENLVFPFGQKIQVDNFNGSLNELNEIKRKIWIYSKMRDSFVHGNKFILDSYENKIIINNDITSDDLGSFKINLILPPEILNYLCGIFYEPDAIFYESESNERLMNEETLERYKYIIKNIKHKDLKQFDNKEFGLIMEEIDDIDDNLLLTIVLNKITEYYKNYIKYTDEEKEKLTEELIRIIVIYSGRCRANNGKTKQLFDSISNILGSREELYHAALYSHMVYVFSDSKNIVSNNIKTQKLKIENDIYSQIIKKAVMKVNNEIEKMTNQYIDKEKIKMYIVNNMYHLLELVKIRNRWIINNIRNSIEHKNVIIRENEIEMFNRVDNTSEEINFKCTTTYEDMNDLLKSIEYESEELNVDEFIEEIKNICGDGDTVRKFSESLIIFENYINSKKENNEEDKPPKF